VERDLRMVSVDSTELAGVFPAAPLPLYYRFQIKIQYVKIVLKKRVLL